MDAAGWVRPSKIGGMSLWGSQGIRPDAVKQGGLGDCWFLSVISAMGEWPDRVKAMIPNYSEARGIYEFKFWEDGRPVKVVIDDRIPTYSSTSTSPMFLRKPASGALWQMLMEKAGAKYWGTYERMNGGLFEQAYYAMTGRASYSAYKTPSTDAFYNKMKAHEQDHDVMWSACFGGDLAKANKIVGGHAYALIGVKDFTDGNNKQWKLAHVRNPWGSYEYNGTFSDSDTVNMNAATQQKLGHTLHNNDGTFYMPWGLYVQVFTMTSIGRYNANDKYAVVDAVWDRQKHAKMNALTFSLNNPVEQDV